MIPRIRTVKPETATHELLWYCEHVTALPIIRSYVFLWNWTDRRGLFEWKPRVLKQGIAPYDQIDFEHVLNVLANAGFIVKYIDTGRLFGWVPRFLHHQQINGRESDSRLPMPSQQVIDEHEARVLRYNFENLTREQLITDAPVLGGDVGALAREGGRSVTHPDASLVYYARDGAVVKIGCSVNPWARVAELRTARPALQLVATEMGGVARERARHTEFSSLREQGEWFRWESPLSDLVVKLRSRANDVRLDDLDTRDPSQPPSVVDAPPPEQNRTELNRTELNGKDSVESPQKNAPTSTAGDGLVLVDERSKRLPAVHGKRTATALVERLGAVLDEVRTGERARLTKQQLRELQAEFVFTYWANVHSHLTSVMDEKRLRRIMARLDENGGDVGELLYAIDGAKRDPHLQGQNDRKTTYDGVQTIFRDREIVERLASSMSGHKQGKEHKMLAKWGEIVRDFNTQQGASE